MKRRFKGLFLVCIICVVLTGCGKQTIPVTSIAQYAMEQLDCVPINESKTMYYSINDYSVKVLNDYYTRFGKRHATLDTLIINEKTVYYDIKNNCYTTEPPLAD